MEIDSLEVNDQLVALAANFDATLDDSVLSELTNMIVEALQDAQTPMNHVDKMLDYVYNETYKAFPDNDSTRGDVYSKMAEDLKIMGSTFR